ncbi:MAG TPA: hypothetical protein VGJ20_05895 [Xanthobacteraceae bacterium]|jgi:hypothetical protein
MKDTMPQALAALTLRELPRSFEKLLIVAIDWSRIAVVHLFATNLFKASLLRSSLG